jgi:hypothetical protein
VTAGSGLSQSDDIACAIVTVGTSQMTGKLNVGSHSQADTLTQRYLDKIAYEFIEMEFNLGRCYRLPIWFAVAATGMTVSQWMSGAKPACGANPDSRDTLSDTKRTLPAHERPRHMSDLFRIVKSALWIQAWARAPRRSRNDRRRL